MVHSAPKCVCAYVCAGARAYVMLQLLDSVLMCLAFSVNCYSPTLSISLSLHCEHSPALTSPLAELFSAPTAQGSLLIKAAHTINCR